MKLYHLFIYILFLLVSSGKSQTLNEKMKLADSLFEIDNMHESAKLYKDIIDNEKSQNLPLLNVLYHKAGVSFLYIDELEQSLKYLIKSEELSFLSNDSYQAAKTQSNIAIVFQKKKNHKLGIEYNLKAVKNFEATNSFNEAMRVYNNLGISFRNQGQFQESEVCFKKSLSLVETHNFDKNEKAPIFSNLALLQMDKENYGKALEYSLEAWSLIIESGNSIPKSRISAVLSEIYFKLNNGALAEKFAKISLENSILSNNIERQASAYNHLANAYEIQNNFKEALSAHRLFKLLNDSIVSINNENALNEMMVSYRTKEKENENIVLQQKNQIQEQGLKEQKFRIKIAIMIVILLIAFSVILYRAYKKSRTAYKNLVRKNIEIAKKQYEGNQNISISDYANRQKELIIQQFENEIINKKEFLNASISVESISNQLQTNKTYLSNALNNHYGKNFQSIINELRINVFISLLDDNQHHSFTIESLSEKCGFSNRASFYTAFKKHTGITPSTFIKNME